MLFVNTHVSELVFMLPALSLVSEESVSTQSQESSKQATHYARTHTLMRQNTPIDCQSRCTWPPITKQGAKNSRTIYPPHRLVTQREEHECLATAKTSLLHTRMYPARRSAYHDDTPVLCMARSSRLSGTAATLLTKAFGTASDRLQQHHTDIQ